MEVSAPGSAGSPSNFNGRAADKLVELSASVVGAYVSHNALNVNDLPRLIAGAPGAGDAGRAGPG
jgi:predicted transcriptional regulator